MADRLNPAFFTRERVRLIQRSHPADRKQQALEMLHAWDSHETKNATRGCLIHVLKNAEMKDSAEVVFGHLVDELSSSDSEYADD